MWSQLFVVDIFASLKMEQHSASLRQPAEWKGFLRRLIHELLGLGEALPVYRSAETMKVRIWTANIEIYVFGPIIALVVWPQIPLLCFFSCLGFSTVLGTFLFTIHVNVPCTQICDFTVEKSSGLPEFIPRGTCASICFHFFSDSSS